MGCCLSKLTKNYWASAMAATEMSKKIGMMEKYAQKEMGEGRSTYPGPSLVHLEEGLDIIVGKMKTINEEAQEIIKTMNDGLEKASKLRFYQIEQFHVRAQISRMSHLDKFAIDKGEDILKTLIHDYDVAIDTVTFKKTGGKQNWYRSGVFLYQLCFQYGCLPELDVWHEKVIKDYTPLKLDQTHNYSTGGTTTVAEVGDLTITAMHILIIMGEKGKARQLFDVIGFKYDDIGSKALLDAIWKMGIGAMGTYSKDTWIAMNKLLVFLSLTDDAQEACKQSMKVWIETQDLPSLNKSWFTQTLGHASVMNIGARVYEILGDYENARILAEEGIQYQRKKSVISDCHIILGRIAAKNGSMEVANACFQKGSDVAHEAQCYFLGLLAGKECNLAGGSGGDQMIDRACMAMKKRREEFSKILVGE
eukprot:g2437.t1